MRKKHKFKMFDLVKYTAAGATQICEIFEISYNEIEDGVYGFFYSVVVIGCISSPDTIGSILWSKTENQFKKYE